MRLKFAKFLKGKAFNFQEFAFLSCTTQFQLNMLTQYPFHQQHPQSAFLPPSHENFPFKQNSFHRTLHSEANLVNNYDIRSGVPPFTKLVVENFQLNSLTESAEKQRRKWPPIKEKANVPSRLLIDFMDDLIINVCLFCLFQGGLSGKRGKKLSIWEFFFCFRCTTGTIVQFY